MQTTEVTQGQWQAVMGSNPANSKSCGADCPVEQVSWNAIQTFIATLNGLGDGHYRLPTEAEWEYAARAGSITAFANGEITQPTGNDPVLNLMGWYTQNRGSTTHAVGSQDANEWGLYDMHGNVWEWVQDWYGPYGSKAVVDPQGPTNTRLFRVFRGGGWYDYARGCRSATRSKDTPGSSYDNRGFRLLRTP
jgi:formylglycine-generating enzyme required for sulfatase activity